MNEADTSRGAGPPFAAEPLDHHGGSRPRGLANAQALRMGDNRFGRMFPDLAPLDLPAEVLAALAGSMTGPAPPVPENPDLDSGHTYLSQFVDHDITFDPASNLEIREDPEDLRNVRTPRFDLDSLYGAGPLDEPYLYDQDDPVKLLVGRNANDAFEPDDLPRNHQGRAVIGDPRNDVHVIIAQLTLALLRFHNAIVDHLRSRFLPEDELFGEARRLTSWHYQWVVVHDHLRALVGPEVMDQVWLVDPTTGEARVARRFFTWEQQPFIPVEFSVAAYRFGHSQVRPTYQLNRGLGRIPMFSEARDPHPLQHLAGFRPLPKGWAIEWPLFLRMDGSSPQPSMRVDTTVSLPLSMLPVTVDRQRRSLALLNLLRGQALGLPSGQDVAAAMGTAMPDRDLNLRGPTPLWYYLLRESEVVAEGLRLGPTSGRIVAEVLLGLLGHDRSSFLSMAPAWRPELPANEAGHFTLVDLLRFAGVA